MWLCPVFPPLHSPYSLASRKIHVKYSNSLQTLCRFFPTIQSGEAIERGRTEAALRSDEAQKEAWITRRRPQTQDGGGFGGEKKARRCVEEAWRNQASEDYFQRRTTATIAESRLHWIYLEKDWTHLSQRNRKVWSQISMFGWSTIVRVNEQEGYAASVLMNTVNVLVMLLTRWS